MELLEDAFNCPSTTKAFSTKFKRILYYFDLKKRTYFNQIYLNWQNLLAHWCCKAPGLILGRVNLDTNSSILSRVCVLVVPSFGVTYVMLSNIKIKEFAVINNVPFACRNAPSSIRKHVRACNARCDPRAAATRRRPSATGKGTLLQHCYYIIYLYTIASLVKMSKITKNYNYLDLSTTHDSNYWGKGWGLLLSILRVISPYFYLFISLILLLFEINLGIFLSLRQLGKNRTYWASQYCFYLSMRQVKYIFNIVNFQYHRLF